MYMGEYIIYSPSLKKGDNKMSEVKCPLKNSVEKIVCDIANELLHSGAHSTASCYITKTVGNTLIEVYREYVSGRRTTTRSFIRCRVNKRIFGVVVRKLQNHATATRVVKLNTEVLSQAEVYYLEHEDMFDIYSQYELIEDAQYAFDTYVSPCLPDVD